MLIGLSFKSLYNVIVFWRAFLGWDDIFRILDIKQVLSSLNCLKAMCDHDDRKLVTSLLLVVLNVLNSSLYFLFTLGVKRRSCLVQDKDLGILYKCPSDCKSLLLSS